MRGALSPAAGHSKELGGTPPQPDARRGHAQPGPPRRHLDVALQRDRRRALGGGLGDELRAVDWNALDRHEEVTRTDASRVVDDAADLDVAITVEHRTSSAREIGQPHSPQDNRVVIAEIGGRRFEWGTRTYVMGIVNVTPDSFSGDGLGTDVEAAVAQGLRMVEEGADMLDVGGESTRPGHVQVSTVEEISRTEAVVRRLAGPANVPISIDTYKQQVAESAIAAGATILNDVWGLSRSPAIADLAASHGCAMVLMHNQDGTDYAGDLLQEIKRFLGAAAARAVSAGVPKEQVILDPGIGFGKTAEHNWEVMRRLHELKELGHPILIGTSRKSFIGKLLDLPVTERLESTAGTGAGGGLRGGDNGRAQEGLPVTPVGRAPHHTP